MVTSLAGLEFKWTNRNLPSKRHFIRAPSCRYDLLLIKKLSEDLSSFSLQQKLEQGHIGVDETFSITKLKEECLGYVSKFQLIIMVLLYQPVPCDIWSFLRAHQILLFSVQIMATLFRSTLCISICFFFFTTNNSFFDLQYF